MTEERAETFPGADLGQCRWSDQRIFFPLRGEPTEPAKAICATCPVRTPCQDWAIPNEKIGIWGGLSERQRRAERRRRRLPEPSTPLAPAGPGPTTDGDLAPD